jgi:phosphoribosylaminoimidazole-succinocarboxamide synthase
MNRKHTGLSESITPIRLGKVRDIYDAGDALLMVTSDRLSAFDVVLPDTIPNKGIVLNQLSIHWFEQIKGIVDNHIISSDVDQYPSEFRKYRSTLDRRSMLVKKAEPFPVECIVRGYISGSGWKSYQESGQVCSIPLPKGLRESEKLAEPLFTPSTKAEVGIHDINISIAQTMNLIGEENTLKLQELSLEIYTKCAALALEQGIIIADTKFEFGMYNGEIILIDEVLTPDSSRFWSLENYCPGQGQKSFDKQYVRDWLTRSGWDKTPPGPNLPRDVISRTSRTYVEIYEQLTQNKLIV